MTSWSLRFRANLLSYCSIRNCALRPLCSKHEANDINAAIKYQKHTKNFSKVKSGRADASFQDPRVVTLLQRITGLNLDKIYDTLPQAEMVLPTYKLMTNEALKAAEEKAIQEAKRLLSMPPQLSERDPNIANEIAVDQEIKGYDDEEDIKYIFTDISLSATDQDRRIVVRESDGTLRYANWDERDRMNQIYYPKLGRKLTVPAVFLEENMKMMYNQGRHAEFLDLTVLQFEPDSLNYIQAHHKTYEDIDLQKSYDLLRSTRHFGGLAYYLIKNNRFHGLLSDMLNRKLVDDACDVMELCCLLHPDSQFAEEVRDNELDSRKALKTYIELHLKQFSEHNLDELLNATENQHVEVIEDANTEKKYESQT